MIFATIIEWRTHLPRPVPRAHPPIPRRAGQPNHVDGFRLLIQPSAGSESRSNPPTDRSNGGRSPTGRAPCIRSALLHVPPCGRHGPRPGAMPLLSSSLAAETILAPLFYSAPGTPTTSRPVPSPAAPSLMHIHTSVRLHAQTRGTRSSSSS
jgi:hypothetical protein